MHAMRWRRGMDLEKFAVAGERALSLIARRRCDCDRLCMPSVTLTLKRFVIHSIDEHALT
eukprot:scaffold5397_cov126-Skeletonema_marinoi.AAC.14